MAIGTFLRAYWDRILALVLVVLGAIALLLGWIGISGTGLTPLQNPFLISGGLGGLALIGVGCTVWVSADLQDEWRRLDAIEERLGAIVSAGIFEPAHETSNGAGKGVKRQGSEAKAEA